ncbi:MAG: YggS family pyridoxal phosphate-dependent enzyme [Acidobacteriota bacterium]|jgi:pyridoxal phosphate enzyme (YggS family)|nr:YggS family pyridoxal phosphate-dependent enzyme [Acidobacteriota bacterium]MDQ3373392.1 YggS family pyridoxal phosphate-dependent enzyme [Acidobacteriota bacterium]
MQNYLCENLVQVRKRIQRAAHRSGRNADDITLIAVSKTHPVNVLREAIIAGADVFGENKVQEAEEKIEEIGKENLKWHLIGNLQSNKARKAVKLFDVIHTLDSVELAMRLERICKEENEKSLEVLVQIDLANEATKNGVAVSDLPKLVDFLQTCNYLKFSGLMIIPPFFDEFEKVRPFFKRLREIRDELLRKNAFANKPGELSMGMSHDFEIAIEEGATLVRVGTAIFGRREINPR